MSFKKLICLLLSLALALGLALPALAEGGALEGKLVILHTNDVHGRAVSANGVWGYAAITQVKKDLEAQGAPGAAAGCGRRFSGHAPGQPGLRQDGL